MEGYENQGVFTYALLEGLEKAEGNENGDILIDLRNTVPRITNDRWHLWFRQLDLAPFDRLIWTHPLWVYQPHPVGSEALRRP